MAPGTPYYMCIVIVPYKAILCQEKIGHGSNYCSYRDNDMTLLFGE